MGGMTIGWRRAGVVALGLACVPIALAAEMGAPGLDGGAMEQFLVERLGEAPGFWAIPVTYSAFVGALSVALLAAGLAQLRIASWWAVGVIGAGMVAHAIGAESELVEILSQWVIAAGVLWTAVGVWRAMGATLPRNGRSDPARREAAALE